jgi:hypothetical protein
MKFGTMVLFMGLSSGLIPGAAGAIAQSAEDDMPLSDAKVQKKRRPEKKDLADLSLEEVNVCED